MSYDYQKERPKLFAEIGFKTWSAIGDNVLRHLEYSGAVTTEKALQGITGDSWLYLAALDYLVETGEIVKVTNPESSWDQYQIFIRVKK